ncbi:hypothetical protein QUB10_02730 [Microcoleus sp. B5-D4]|uniref:hypothetical protein n=1 Tax=unclassified Microcoleus TaxID=2642155 RepID=UPI002FD5D0B7
MPEQKYSIVLRECRLLGAGDDRPTVDIAIEDDQIVAVSHRVSELGEREIDIQGNLVSPPFVDSHIHLDSALTESIQDTSPRIHRWRNKNLYPMKLAPRIYPWGQCFSLKSKI